MIWIYDSEVTAYDWLFVFKNTQNSEYEVMHNDWKAVKKFIEEEEPILCGFNNKHYDQFILKSVLAGCTPEEVKSVNDDIISHGINGWDLELPSKCRTRFEQFDLMDDVQTGTSLKSFEAHYGMPITESSISFDIDHEWSDEELEEMVYYCKKDVDATEELFRLRKNYLQTKLDLARVKGIDDIKALGMTNARLTAAYLDASPVSYEDEREYKYPSNLLRYYIPEQMFAFFDRMHDKSIPDEELFTSKLEFKIGDCEVTVGFGGIHGAIPHYREKAGKDVINHENHS